MRSTGHGFCGLSRKNVAADLPRAGCEELGREASSSSARSATPRRSWATRISSSCCDGDQQHRDPRPARRATSNPTLDWRVCEVRLVRDDEAARRPSPSSFKLENEHGLFQVHAYPFQKGKETLSTWIVECHEDVWRRAGFDERERGGGGPPTCEDLFAADLDGDTRLLTQPFDLAHLPRRSSARPGSPRPTVVLIGDAAHTAHFSIGSRARSWRWRTRSFSRHAFPANAGTRGRAPRPSPILRGRAAGSTCSSLQKAAQTSRLWFEHTRALHAAAPAAVHLQPDDAQQAHHLRQSALSATRSWWKRSATTGSPRIRTAPARSRTGSFPPAPPIFTPLSLRGAELPNRMVVSPMCQYSARGRRR